MKFRTIRSKILFYIGVFNVILFAIIITTILVFSNIFYKRTFRENAKVVVNLTRTEISEIFQSYFVSSPLRFKEKISSLLESHPSLEQILIISPNGKIVFDSDELKGLTYTTGLAEKYKIKNFETSELDNECLDFVVPVLNDRGILVNTIVYRFSKSPIRKFRNFVIIFSLLAFSVLAGFGIFYVTLVTKPIVKNIEKLKKIAENIEQGNYSVRSNIKSHDEIQYLSDTFNSMLESLVTYIYNLKSMVHELEQRDRSREELLARISHEMRTPLTVSIGYIDLLKTGKLGSITDKQRESLELILKNLRRLEEETRNLLKSTQMALNAYRLNITEFEIEPVINRILENFASDISKKRLNVQLKLEHKTITSDEEHFYYILSNLISNAIKFSYNDGEIIIKLKEETDNSERYFTLTVFNTGDKIPEEELPKIFEPFYQIESKESLSLSGVGLGLYIVKRATEVLKGHVEVQNLDNGVEFKVYIPRVNHEEDSSNRR
ncbi:MAG: HAMP domain-containing sensor histidine kinase [candidate division WOR-3 bacterium]